MTTMESDQIEMLGGSTIQHGPNSDRIYLMKLADADAESIAGKLEKLAKKNGYSKIFAKIPASASKGFLAQGYSVEARVPGFFNGREECLFLGRYLTSERNRDPEVERVQKVLLAAKERESRPAPQRSGLDVTVMQEGQAEVMAELFDRVFDSYPFPINDPSFIITTMRSHVRYYGVFGQGELLALASAEMDRKARNVEMTDFATLPQARGKGLAGVLLASMEKDMAQEGICTAYTIARARSYGMNIVFARADYVFGGTLVNNTGIAGGLESMNVWYKPLVPCA